jgi:hypothetical protein
MLKMGHQLGQDGFGHLYLRENKFDIRHGERQPNRTQGNKQG